ncbi:hypothetical protein ACIRBX_13200 [Kitasatospora sp. NPDC096147]|uniref:hypothetical protein n=1 Tax=Kitasatospora sp. NPDC096147 TaxID=3364093 RepID=UPI00382F3453
MRVVVVDDYIEVGQTVQRALAADGHRVTVALSPEALEPLLDQQSFELALVDLDFGHESTLSGLAALRLLADREVPTVVYSADSEQSRLLFLLTAFQYHRPVGLMPKNAPSRDIRAMAAGIADGAPGPAAALAERYRPPAAGPSLLDGLLAGPGDLPVWRALSQYSRREELARVTHRSTKWIDNFLKARHPVVEELEQRYHRRSPAGPALPPAEAGRAAARQALIIPVCSFARANARFFADPEVLLLLAARQVPAPPRHPGAGTLFGRPRRGRS